MTSMSGLGPPWAVWVAGALGGRQGSKEEAAKETGLLCASNRVEPH